MKKLWSILLCFYLFFSTVAYGWAYSVAHQASHDIGVVDEPAQKLINKVCDEYQRYNSLQMEFILHVKHSNFSSTETIKGYRVGNKYRLISKNRDVICNGKSIWSKDKKTQKTTSTLPNAKEINAIFPERMLRIYQQRSDVHLMGEMQQGKGTVQQLEFIPKNKLESFSKIQIYIDKNTSQILGLKQWNKDGSLYVMEFKNMLYNIKIDPSKFEIAMS